MLSVLTTATLFNSKIIPISAGPTVSVKTYGEDKFATKTISSLHAT